MLRIKKKEKIFFISSNGIGMGHLTRLLSLATRRSDHIEPVFLSLSKGVSVLKDFNIYYEYIPSYKELGISKLRWNMKLYKLLMHHYFQFRPSAIVFDGTTPYIGMIAFMYTIRRCAYIWCRRAMWKIKDSKLIANRSKYFDKIIEPGDLASSVDDGATTIYREKVEVVDPIILLDRDKILDRQSARKKLNIDQNANTVLIQLGSGNNNKSDIVFQRIVERLLMERDVELFVLSNILSEKSKILNNIINLVTGYPFSMNYLAFDAVISAAGYNSFHELLSYSIPTVFVPNKYIETDNQHMRATFAERCGYALCIKSGDENEVDDVISSILNINMRTKLRNNCNDIQFSNGAISAMRIVENTIRRKITW